VKRKEEQGNKGREWMRGRRRKKGKDDSPQNSPRSILMQPFVSMFRPRPHEFSMSEGRGRRTGEKK
jgi:hypothetical protein